MSSIISSFIEEGKKVIELPVYEPLDPIIEINLLLLVVVFAVLVFMSGVNWFNI